MSFHRLLVLTLVLAGFSACGTATNSEQAASLETPEQVSLDLPPWWNEATYVPVGETFSPDVDDEVAHTTLRALGYTREDPSLYRRKADLLTTAELTPSAMWQYPSIDAIAIVSVYRPNLKKQYLHDTLRSLLSELPDTARINVMVGNGETDYVSQDVLIHELGKDKASQVHIVETPQDVAALFQAENYGASSKACWNYARTLRSYNGKGRILLLEDDVELAIGAFRQLRPWLDAPLEESVSLYNGICHKDNLLKAPLFSQLAVANKSIRRSSDFPTIQAMLFSASITREAGEYLISRANRETHDYMLGRVLATRSRKMSFVYPSIFQHRGFITTGLSGPDVPVSKCYQGEFRDR